MGKYYLGGWQKARPDPVLASSVFTQAQLEQINGVYDEEVSSMFVYDIPNALPHDPQLTVQAAALQVAQSQKIPAITLDWPWIVPSDPQYAYKPGRFASNLAVDACSMLLYSSKFKYLKWTSPTCKLVEVVTQPKHGTLINEGNGAYGFKPESGYLGKDSFKYIVEGIDGRRVLITMPILMKTMAEAFSFNPVPNSSGWLISQQQDGSALWSEFLNFSGLSDKVGLSFVDLPGTVVAQTTGEGQGATITFDTTAAGNGWFIDATPADNAEYLPTSNPNQWIAKDGSEAANKMDLLSVLLHEYGHALGIEHSPDGNDFMAATLQPGVRRLPSTEELALMAQLAGQARLALDGSDVPDAPNPALPLTALGFALFGRIRRTDYGAWTIQAESASLLPQYQIAINPTLSPLPNPLPQAGEGANGAAFGSETGPSDAFEVALLNANIGEALTGTDGLSQSDAGTNQRGQLLH